MNRPRTELRALLALATLVALLAASPAAIAQEMPPPEELARIMERHAEAAMPGPEHELLERMTGTWDVEITMWPEPGAEPTTVPGGVVEAEMILGGRFLQQRGRTEAELFTETLIILGYDRRGGEYNLMAMDTHGTYWVTARGQATSPDSLLLSGTDYDPIGEFEQVYDFVIRFEDPDTLVTEIVFKDAIHTRGGEPFTMVRTRAVRRSAQ